MASASPSPGNNSLPQPNPTGNEVASTSLSGEQGVMGSTSTSPSKPIPSSTSVPMGMGIATALPPHMSSMSSGQAPSTPTPNRNDRDKDRPIDMRAEEDAARRYNIGRLTGNTRYGAGPRSKRTDLFGPELKAKLDRMARDHQISFDDESLAYLSMAAETRLRDILSTSISAQQHRTTTSFLHPPPSASSSNTKGERAMWAVSVNSDPTALLEAMNKTAKEAERDFRTARMNRLAKEHEMERIRERAMGMGDAEGYDPSSNQVGSPGQGQGEGGGEEPKGPNTNTSEVDEDTPASAPGSSPPASSPSGPTSNGPSSSTSTSTPKPKSSAPVFGAVQPRKPSSTPGSSSKKKNPKDVSSDVQIKMSNMTAMRSAGMGKKYSWMNNAPSISSPLSGGRKKGKKAKAGAEGEAEGEGEEEGEGMDVDDSGAAGAGAGDQTPSNSNKKRKKSNLSHSHTNNADNGNGSGESHKRQKKRRMPTLPTRRLVSVALPASGIGAGMGPGPMPMPMEEKEKLVPDDRCLTLPDVVFAMERDGSGSGRGMGTGDEVVRRAMARPGGIWGLGRS